MKELAPRLRYLVKLYIVLNKGLITSLFQLTVRLKIGDLQKVKNELWDARTYWKDFGLALSMSQNTLDSIAITQRDDPGNCLREMLAEWLRGAGDPPRTWSTITAALKQVKPLEAIAEEVEGKHGTGSSNPTATQSQGILCSCHN